jgi:hypothetical protein
MMSSRRTEKCCRAIAHVGFRKVFGELMVRDVVKSLLIFAMTWQPLRQFHSTASKLLMADAFDFSLWQVCGHKQGGPCGVASLDGQTRLLTATTMRGVDDTWTVMVNLVVAAVTTCSTTSVMSSPSLLARTTTLCCHSMGAPLVAGDQDVGGAREVKVHLSLIMF